MAVLLLIGVLVRAAALGSMPGGVNQDEAYSAYEAWCLLRDGMDSWGYRFPVYLRAWGSGMNALQSYLMMPFIALFGLKTWVVRLPQLIVACASLLAFYALMRRIAGRRAALTGLFLLVISPWHIMLSRWGLESNLAPGFLLFGMLFFVKGAEDSRWYVLSGLFYGLSLYAYATIWPVVPAMLAMLLIVLIYTRKIAPDRYVCAGVGVLFLLAVPLMLFMLVNQGMIHEISTPFLSVPVMLSMRTYDVAPGNFYENLYDMVMMVLRQRDDTLWNATREFGLYYHISLPLMIAGGVRALARSFRALKQRQWDPVLAVLAQLLCAVVLGLFVESNVNRLNCIHIPLLALAALGVDGICCAIRGAAGQRLYAAVLAGYALCFALFTGYYFTAYQGKLDPLNDKGLDRALACAAELTDGEICISDEILYSKVLFYEAMEPELFRETAIIDGGSSAFVNLASAGRFRFGIKETTVPGGVCIVRAEQVNGELPEGFYARIFDSTAVVFGADPM
ncbi:MAG: glycosyltransferase family 39 protein [Clostridia bacterium]|nr:glycosyltransferase family 39 protein [Clostridia bacterium]